jgi:hypothetical protein
MSKLEEDRRMLHKIADELTADDNIYFTVRRGPAGEERFQMVTIHIEKDQKKKNKCEDFIPEPALLDYENAALNDTEAKEFWDNGP